MTDKEFNRKMSACINAKDKYYSMLYEIEGEYERRFGVLPSDISDDSWIDTFHSPAPSATIKVSDIINSPSLQLYIKNRASNE